MTFYLLSVVETSFCAVNSQIIFLYGAYRDTIFRTGYIVNCVKDSAAMLVSGTEVEEVFSSYTSVNVAIHYTVLKYCYRQVQIMSNQK